MGRSLWLILLLLAGDSNGQAQAAPAPSAKTTAATTQSASVADVTASAIQRLHIGVDGVIVAAKQQHTAATATTAATTTLAVINASSSSNEQPRIKTTATVSSTSSNIEHFSHLEPVESVVQLLYLELTAAPPINNGHDGLKLTKKKQLQQQHFPTETTTVMPATTTIETEVERIPTITTDSSSSSTSSQPPNALLPVPNGYLGPIFMGEKTFSVVHPLKKPQQFDDSIESQLREGRIVEILAPTALLESNLESSSMATTSTTTTTTTNLPTAPQSVLSTTVFHVPEMQQQTSTTRLPLAEISVGGLGVLAAPPRTESKISDIQIEVYDSTVDSIVASTNFRDNQGYYPLPLEPEPGAVVGTTRPPSSPVVQERFTQYVIDRADVSTQPAAEGLGKPEPAAIEIHINVSEAFGNESEDLEFSYRQPTAGGSASQPSKSNDEILVVEIIDNNAGDNSTENSASSEHINQQSYAVRPPQDPQDELFLADRSGSLPRPPYPPPPPPMPRKPTIDRDSDTIFYISNTEVKVGESLPTASSGSSSEQQQRKLKLENQFFPASYSLDQQAGTPRYEEDIFLSPLHNTADALKILRSPNNVGGDGAPPLDVTYVGESVIEVEQQGPLPLTTQQSDIIIQPAVLPDLAIGVPVIGELPPQIELKEIDYMPGELLGHYENDIDNNGLGMGNADPDINESSIQYGGDLIDDGAGGGFDGVEGSYPFESPSQHRLQQQDHPQSQSQSHYNHGFSHLHREQLPVAEILNATLQHHNESSDLGGGASAMAPLLHAGNHQLPERMGNATALSEDPLADYDGFLNLFAVSMGLIIVIIPAGILTSMYCAVRYLLNKNANSSAPGDDSEQGQGQDSKQELSSCSSIASQSSPSSQLCSQPDYSNPNSNCSSNSNSNPNAALIQSMSLALASGVQRIEFQFESRPDAQTPTPISDTTPTTGTPTFGRAFAFSGSVTKMTLKDNHLIVVTEERHDISRHARETKMHTEKDGVFVVEVARGIDSKQLPESPAAGVDITELPFDTNSKQAAAAPLLDVLSMPPSHEQVQIHAPPSDFANPLPAGVAGADLGNEGIIVPAAGLQLIEEEDQQLAEGDEPQQPGLPSQTGLSQSDLSSTSSSDSNKRYSYGNQELYVIEQPGYAGSTHQGGQLEREQKQEELPVPAPVGFGNVQKPKTETKTAVVETENQKPMQEQEQKIEQQEEQELQQVQPEPEPEKAQVEPEPEKSQQEPETAQQEPENTQQEPEPMTEPEPEQNYDSLMSLPAPPSTEEIKELNDFTLIESNQLDSLPPPPPPPPTEAQNGHGHNYNEQEEGEQEKQPKQEALPQIETTSKLNNGNGNGNGNGKICTTASPPATNGVNGAKDEPTTLTPPASAPASPTATGASLCGGNNSLSNGIHPVAVDVNGS